MSRPPLRVLIAEDNADLRDLLVTLVAAEADLCCVGAVGDLPSAFAAVRERPVDVLVLDLELQGRSSLELIRSHPDPTRVVVFSGHSQPEMVRQLLAAGAHAFVPKSSDHDQLLRAIRAVHGADVATL